MADVVRLQTERLLLRPFEEADVSDCLDYRNDAEFARYLPHIPQPFTLLDAEAFVRQNVTELFDQSPTFAIVFEGKVIGTVNLEIDSEDRSAMLGYAIGRTHWGRGLATEAAKAVLSWAFGTLCLNRVWASASAENVRSLRVLEKLGIRPQPPTSEPTFAITSDDWFRQR